MELQVSNTFAPTIGGEDRVTVFGWKALAGSVIGYAIEHDRERRWVNAARSGSLYREEGFW